MLFSTGFLFALLMSFHFEELWGGMADGAPASAAPVITIGYAIVHRAYLTETPQHRARVASRWCKNAEDCGR
jgi:hypothetical protein